MVEPPGNFWVTDVSFFGDDAFVETLFDGFVFGDVSFAETSFVDSLPVVEAFVNAGDMVGAFVDAGLTVVVFVVWMFACATVEIGSAVLFNLFEDLQGKHNKAKSANTTQLTTTEVQ